jgi:squalene-hopene/tetraprenyl-beta-curcumene cyclase
MVDPDRLSAAYETARCDLLAQSVAAGHWTGELSSSALATATAVSALAIVERCSPVVAGRVADERRQSALSQVIMTSVRWLAKHQNSDGGWGDSHKSTSNIPATLAVRYAFALTAVPADHPGLLERADAYIKSQGGPRGLRRRYGRDKTLWSPILANGALAGLVPWRKVPSLPFERICLRPQTWKHLRLPVVSVAVRTMAAVGLARYFHRKPRNPLARFIKRLAFGRSLALVESSQPAGGGFLESIPLTSFAVMSLASMGKADHPVVQKGVEFLLTTVRPDGSWAIGADQAVRNTALAVDALAAVGEDVRELRGLDWILACQRRAGDPLLGTEPGGWSWTDRAGGLPNVHDTATVLLALSAWVKADPATTGKIAPSAAAGVRWLLELQNADGGWPMFARVWNAVAADRGAADLTAAALRALDAWRAPLGKRSPAQATPSDERIGAAIERGLRYLGAAQRSDGCWVSLGFGDPNRPGEDNPVAGTAQALAAYRDLQRLDSPAAARGLDWLAAAAHVDGSWGAVPQPGFTSSPKSISVENTALAVEALLSCGRTTAHQAAAMRGLKWLVDAVEANRHQEPSPIGRSLAKVAYCEKLYPLIWTVAALGRAARRPAPEPAQVDVATLPFVVK